MKVLTTLLLVASCYFSFAQNIEWGEETKEISIGSSYIGNINGENFFSTIEKKGLMSYDRKIAVLNSQLNFDREEKYEPKMNKKELDHDGFSIIDGKMYALGSLRTKKQNMDEVFLMEIDTKTLQPKSSTRKVASYDYKEQSMIVGILEKSRKLYQLERDETGYSVSLQDLDGNNEQNYRMALGSKIDMEDWSYNNLIFDTDRERLYMVGYESLSKKESENKRIRRKYSLFIADEGGLVEHVRMDVKDYIINSTEIELDQNNNLVCAGFFSTQESSLDEGVYYLSVNLDDYDLNASSLIFDKQFIVEGATSNRSAKKAAKKDDDELGLSNNYIDEIIPTADGGIVLTSEKFFITTTTTTNANGRTTTRTTYHYLDVLLFKMDENGEFEWKTRVPKRQSSSSTWFSSYLSYEINGEIIILYNDTRENLEYNSMIDIKNFSVKSKKNIVTMATISEDGRLKREEFNGAKEGKLVLAPTLSRTIDKEAGEYLVGATWYKKVRFGKLTF